LLEEMAGAQCFQIPRRSFEAGNMKSQGSRFLIAVVAFALVPLAGRVRSKQSKSLTIEPRQWS
jgi:hypothetical protein